MTERIRRWLRVELPFLLVLGLIGASVVYLLLFHGHWRRGAGVIAVAMFAGATMRAVLPPVRAGLLAVRSRVTDTVVMAVLGGVILSVAIRLH